MRPGKFCGSRPLSRSCCWRQCLSPRAEDVKVSIDNFTFNPQQLTVKAGTKVTFANHDDIPHTVVSLQNFKSKVLDTEQKFSFTFTTPGTYKYFCSLHPHMTGTIVVEASSNAHTMTVHPRMAATGGNPSRRGHARAHCCARERRQGRAFPHAGAAASRRRLYARALSAARSRPTPRMPRRSAICALSGISTRSAAGRSKPWLLGDPAQCLPRGICAARRSSMRCIRGPNRRNGRDRCGKTVG